MKKSRETPVAFSVVKTQGNVSSKEEVIELSCVTHSAKETIALGVLLAGVLHAGDTLVLTGELGAGKTQLTKGIARGLGITDDVTSPTFTIEMIYKGVDCDGQVLPLYHFDLYRLGDSKELEDTGLYDVLGADGVCVIEWGEQFSEEIGTERLDVCMTRLNMVAASTNNDQSEEPSREIRLIPRCSRAKAIIAALC